MRLDDDGWRELSSPTVKAGPRTACCHPFMTAADADKGWKGVWKEVRGWARPLRVRAPVSTAILAELGDEEINAIDAVARG